MNHGKQKQVKGFEKNEHYAVPVVKSYKKGKGYIVGMRTEAGAVVYYDGKYLNPAVSLGVVNHSPTGFEWGYGGSGPAQLALAISLKAHKGSARGMYQKFKFDVIAGLKKEKFRLSLKRVKAWFAKEEKRLKKL